MAFHKPVLDFRCTLLVCLKTFEIKQYESHVFKYVKDICVLNFCLKVFLYLA